MPGSAISENASRHFLCRLQGVLVAGRVDVGRIHFESNRGRAVFRRRPDGKWERESEGSETIRVGSGVENEDQLWV
jgi:hypothetical protein